MLPRQNLALPSPELAHPPFALRIPSVRAVIVLYSTDDRAAGSDSFHHRHHHSRRVPSDQFRATNLLAPSGNFLSPPRSTPIDAHNHAYEGATETDQRT